MRILGSELAGQMRISRLRGAGKSACFRSTIYLLRLYTAYNLFFFILFFLRISALPLIQIEIRHMVPHILVSRTDNLARIDDFLDSMRAPS